MVITAEKTAETAVQLRGVLTEEVYRRDYFSKDTSWNHVRSLAKAEADGWTISVKLINTFVTAGCDRHMLHWRYDFDADRRMHGSGSSIVEHGRDRLCSFSTHYELVRRLDSEKAGKSGAKFICNADSVSHTTRRHLSDTWGIFFDQPRVSFRALQCAIEQPEDPGKYFRWRISELQSVLDLTSLELIDWTFDKTDGHNACDPGFDDFVKSIPAGATVSRSHDASGNLTRVSYHLIGGTLWRHGDRYLLAGMDEGSYFVSELSRPVSTIAEAYASLKPELVTWAEGQDYDIKRQGEWYFIRADQALINQVTGSDSREEFPGMLPAMSDVVKLQESAFHEPEDGADITVDTWREQPGRTRGFLLPRPFIASNIHVATRGMPINRTTFLVSGRIRHVNPYTLRSSGEHRTLKLGKTAKEAWIAVRNTERGAWSAGVGKTVVD